MNDLVETYRGMVYPWHCDHMGHMNVMWYVGKFDEATWNLFAAVGITTAFLKENRRGMAAVQQNITYRRELIAGDAQRRHGRGFRHLRPDRRADRHPDPQVLPFPAAARRARAQPRAFLRAAGPRPI